jgi:hypothetical protein
MRARIYQPRAEPRSPAGPRNASTSYLSQTFDKGLKPLVRHPYRNSALTLPNDSGVTAGSFRLKYWTRWLRWSTT